MFSPSFSQYQPIIRPAHIKDGEEITNLCQQLGYAVNHEEIKERLHVLMQDNSHIIYVAIANNNFSNSPTYQSVIGWVHAHKSYLIMMPPQVLVYGLVVDENYRRIGIGRLLMQNVEQWAISGNCQTVRLRSNIIRKDAHRFYEKIGYQNTKHSLEFCKHLQ